MEPLEPTDLEIGRHVRRDVRVSVIVPEGFKRFSANGSVVLMAERCAIVVAPVTEAFTQECKKLHAAGGLTPVETTIGDEGAVRYDVPGQKRLYYLDVDGVAFQVALDPRDSNLGIKAIPDIISSLKVIGDRAS